MSLPYVDINQAINANGLRLIVVQGMPSAWGIAVRGMIEYKSLDYTLGPQKPMGGKPGAAGVVGYQQRTGGGLE